MHTGTGVHVYVLDTGIWSTHHEFRHVQVDGAHVSAQSRVAAGFSAFGSSTQDCHGHGTHVAAVIGGVWQWLRDSSY
jgi:subtilisin family serine protease